MRGVIFGATAEKARKKLDTLIEEYQKYWDIAPARIITNCSTYKVQFTNGDIWDAVGCTESNFRGRKANVILIDYDISLENKHRISYCLVNYPYGAIGYF